MEAQICGGHLGWGGDTWDFLVHLGRTSHTSLSDNVDDSNKHRNITLIPKWITLLCLAYFSLGSTKNLAFTISTVDFSKIMLNYIGRWSCDF